MASAVLVEQPGLILVGKQAIDDDSNQTGQTLAALLGIAQATFASMIEIGDGKATDSAVRRLMTITGVDLTVSVGIIAAIGDVARFTSPQKLVSYFGLSPRVHRSGSGSGPSLPHQQGRPQPRAGDAGRGGMGRGKGARAPARVLRSDPSKAGVTKIPWGVNSGRRSGKVRLR
jgi:hypothetical protein